MRQLPREVCDELCRRAWDYTKGNKMAVETKADMKERTGESPDLADTFVTAFEGARRRGFQIQRLPQQGDVDEDGPLRGQPGRFADAPGQPGDASRGQDHHPQLLAGGCAQEGVIYLRGEQDHGPGARR